MQTAAVRLETIRPAPRPCTRDIDDAMTRYARGDDDAFATIYAFVAPRLASYLRRRMRDQARVPDLVQMTFLHMHRARRTFMEGAEVLPWAFAIARRQMVDAFRCAERDPTMTVADAEPHDRQACAGEELLAVKEAVQRVEVALAGLSQPQRAAFELVKGHGLSLVQAAAVLGTTVMGVKLRTHRAYAALRLALVPTD